MNHISNEWLSYIALASAQKRVYPLPNADGYSYIVKLR
ncbi:hypothetical protein CRD_01994 [Raphidiopsis brookii D9]|nr:hypothetical protein CRD_01994 [Raphidiopsis brookii D9]